MAPNSLAPAFGVISYNSVFGAHKMTIPTLAYSALRGTNGYGGYLAWDGTTDVDAQTMWTDLVNDLKPFMKTTATFNDVTIYTQASATEPAIPSTVIPLAIAGTSSSADWNKATQKTWIFRTGAFGTMKLVLLDLPVGNFDRVLPASWSAGDLAILGALSDATKAWSARDNSIVTVAKSITFKLNDATRKKYGEG